MSYMGEDICQAQPLEIRVNSCLFVVPILVGFLALAGFAQCGLAAEPLRLAIIGDSTVCDYPAEKPERGWGMFIEGYFQPGTVHVSNFAKSGRSTKTFIKEGMWDKTLKERPNFILIQFGHNDS